MKEPREETIVQTQDIGFLVAISRSVKTGTTAAEVSTVRIEGHAKDANEALEVLKQIDLKTEEFVQNERKRYGIAKGQPAERRYIGKS